MMIPTLDTTAQSYRVLYSYQYKTATRGYKSDLDMKVDICDGKSVFYSETIFLRDSLRHLAFDENGDEKDKEITDRLWAEHLVGYGGVTFINFNSMSFTQSYTMLNGLINGESDLYMPHWNITDETMVSREGYSVRKAMADYMGREWTVWYTEEIPLPYGPWLFWGLPGLVIMAVDSEELFIFRYMGLWEIDPSESRYMSLWNMRHERYFIKTRLFNYSLEEAEKMYTRVETDLSYASEMTGINWLGFTDGNGNPAPPPVDYVPLVPSEYWKREK